MGDRGRVVPLLPVGHEFQAGLGIKGTLGQDTDQQDLPLGDGQARSVFFSPHACTHQKEVGQDTERHMMMPAAPTADFIIPHPAVWLAVLETRLIAHA